MPRPIILGVVGDSASGKTTLTRGLVRVLGQEQVSHVCLDDYHRYDRSQRADMGLTPLDPGCNHMDIMGQHLMLLRRGEAIMKPVYRHSDGTFAPPVYLTPGRFLIVEGLLGYHTDALRDCFDIRVFLDPPESLRRRWKVVRDCSRRGYTTNQVLDELDRRERDSEPVHPPSAAPRRHGRAVRRPARRAATIPTPRTWTRTCCCAPACRTPTCRTSSATTPSEGLSLVGADGEQDLRVPGRLPAATALELEERIWEHMHFASHLRSERLGEFTLGTDLNRSDSLAIVQLLVLYHLVTARAKVAVGGAEPARGRTRSVARIALLCA